MLRWLPTGNRFRLRLRPVSNTILIIRVAYLCSFFSAWIATGYTAQFKKLSGQVAVVVRLNLVFSERLTWRIDREIYSLVGSSTCHLFKEKREPRGTVLAINARLAHTGPEILVTPTPTPSHLLMCREWCTNERSMCSYVLRKDRNTVFKLLSFEAARFFEGHKKLARSINCRLE